MRARAGELYVNGATVIPVPALSLSHKSYTVFAAFPIVLCTYLRLRRE